MPEPSALLAFSLATLVLLLLPGPAVLYIVTRTATQGYRAGLASVLGIHLGTAVHVMAAVVGLSAVVAASATAFTAIKLAGACYLGWMGVRALWSARRLPLAPSSEDLETAPYDIFSHQNADIVRLTPEELKARMAAKDAAQKEASD